MKKKLLFGLFLLPALAFSISGAISLAKGKLETKATSGATTDIFYLDSFTAGGVDSLIARQRFVLAPYGVSWKGSSSIVSPTNAQLETVSNWELVEDANGTDIDTKIIPFAAIQLTIA